MSVQEFTDSVADPVVVVRDSSTGVVKAVWLPSAELFSEPAPLRHVSSTALIHGSGHIWVVSLVNLAWTEDLVFKAKEYLTDRFESITWERLETGLSDAIEHPLVLHKVCLFDEHLTLLEIPRLADALLRRWMSLQAVLPEVAELRRMKAEMISNIHGSAAPAVTEFMRLVDTDAACVCGEVGLDLSMYNYLGNPTHQLARLQFVKAFPWLANLVCSAEAKSLWRDLGRMVDDLRSPVIFLSEQLEISGAAVRALNGVAVADVGPFFHEHPMELLSLLDAFPKEFLPKVPEHWRVLQEQYDVAKKFFGRSPAGLVLVKARVAHSLRFAVKFNHPKVQLDGEDVHKVERLRTGLAQATYSYYGIEKNHSLGIQRRAKISQMIDRFLGQLSWSRLLEYSRKFEKSHAEAIEKNLDAIKFISGQKYFDFCPGGKFVTSRGWSVRCLSSSAELRTHGLELGICLATPGHRATYHEECFLGKTVIFAIHDQLGGARSTAEFHLSSVKTAAKEREVHFQLVQHTAHSNRPVDSATRDALESLQAQFCSPVWQTHARNGIRVSLLRNTYSSQDSGISAAHFMTSLQAFRGTFKDKADELLDKFSGDQV